MSVHDPEYRNQRPLTRRELADQIHHELADQGTPISSSKANRLASRIVSRRSAWYGTANSKPPTLAYRDPTGELATRLPRSSGYQNG